MRNLSAALFLAAVPFTANAEGEPLIAALGDSLTAGYGLTPEAGFVPQLQEWLEAQGTPAKIINAGVSGDTTAGGLARAAWTVTPEVQALIVNLGGNDMLRGIDPSSSRENMHGILEYAANQGLPVLLVGQQAPKNFGEVYKKTFDGMYPDLATEFNTLFYPYFFTAIFNEQENLPDWSYFQPDHTHPNAEGVAKIVDAMGPSVQDLIERIEHP